MSIKCAVYFILGPTIIIILWVTTQTQLFLTHFFVFSWQVSYLSSLGRLILKKESFSLVVSPCFWQISPRGCSMIFEGCPAPSTAHGARSAAATELRRSRCCDGDAQTCSVALILRVASATELMLLRWS